MRISCIIPTKDRAEMTCRAIGSVLEQSKPVTEIIVVDDGSTDGTAFYLAERFPAVRILNGSGLGPGLARNAGVAAACGEVVMFLDSDDIWLPGHVADLAGTLALGHEVAYGVALNVDELSAREFFIPGPAEARDGQCLSALSRWCFLVPSAMALRKEAFVASGGFGAGELGEDWCFFIRLAGLFPFAFCGNKPITLRRLHRGSLCNGVNNERLEEMLAAVAIALAEAGAGPEATGRLQRLRDWTKGRSGWQTVQDWYDALKREEMI